MSLPLQQMALFVGDVNPRGGYIAEESISCTQATKTTQGKQAATLSNIHNTTAKSDREKHTSLRTTSARRIDGWRTKETKRAHDENQQTKLQGPCVVCVSRKRHFGTTQFQRWDRFVVERTPKEWWMDLRLLRRKHQTTWLVANELRPTTSGSSPQR